MCWQSLALASVAHLVGAPSGNQKFAGSIPNQGTYLGCRFDPQAHTILHPGTQEAANQCFSLALRTSLITTPFPTRCVPHPPTPAPHTHYSFFFPALYHSLQGTTHQQYLVFCSLVLLIVGPPTGNILCFFGSAPPVRQVLLRSTFYRWGDISPEMVSSLSLETS